MASKKILHKIFEKKYLEFQPVSYKIINKIVDLLLYISQIHLRYYAILLPAKDNSFFLCGGQMREIYWQRWTCHTCNERVYRKRLAAAAGAYFNGFCGLVVL